MHKRDMVAIGYNVLMIINCIFYVRLISSNVVKITEVEYRIWFAKKNNWISLNIKHQEWIIYILETDIVRHGCYISKFVK